MLGYTTATGGFLNSGMPGWNNTLAEKMVSTGVAYPLLTVAALTAPAAMDYTGTACAGACASPTISSWSATATGSTTASVTRIVNRPATSKINLTGSGGALPVNVNDTILNASKTTALTGLVPGTTYTGTLTVYDAQANSASTPISFTTDAPPCTPAKPSLTLSKTSTYWVDYAAYEARLLSVNWTISNTGTNGATNVAITGSTNTNGVSISTVLPASVGNIGAGSSAMKTLVYNVPLTTTGWHTSTTASAGDDCGGIGYTYP
ncbi:MAG: hypothetical protein ACYC0L_09495, partial [Thermoleophilia bacterium]